jgi:predicted AlkP superfamily phosphohydrolase/phosphomutase
VPEAYASLDRAAARLIEAAGPSTDVFVVSECGAGPLRAGVRINALLAAHGLLAMRSRDARPWDRAVAGAAARARRALPARARHLMSAVGAKASVQSYLAGSGIDWARTHAFHRGKGEGNIYVNLRGRERHGIVAPSDYDTVRDRVIAALTDVGDPRSGERAVVAVHRREDLYDGPFVHHAPDLVIEWADAAYMPAERDLGASDHAIFTERVREYMTWPTSGSHRAGGVFLAAGDGLEPRRDIGDVALGDLAPMWCARLGCPLPGVTVAV